jgi:hypothetical protein
VTRQPSPLSRLPRGIARRTLHVLIEHLRAHPRRKALVVRLLESSGGLGAQITRLARSSVDDSSSVASFDPAWKSLETSTPARFRAERQRTPEVDAERLAIERRMEYIAELERRVDELEGELRHYRRAS